MARGFTDKNGKFRPTDNKRGISKSRDQSAKTQGIRMKRLVNEHKIKITQPEQKGKLDSIFYDGQIATMVAKDGTVFELDAVGEVGFFIDDKWFPDVRDAESEYGLNDKILRKLNESNKIRFTNNNWFEITTEKAYGNEISEPIEDYDSAISELEDIVKMYNKGELEL